MTTRIDVQPVVASYRATIAELAEKNSLPMADVAGRLYREAWGFRDEVRTIDYLVTVVALQQVAMECGSIPSGLPADAKELLEALDRLPPVAA